jgi:DNA-binding beta-propeller fold protein YncE
MKPAPPVTRTRSPIGRRICGALRPAALAGLLGGLGAVAVACGGSGFPRAAEPADSPPLTRKPAGRTREIGGEPEGLAFDNAAGLLAVGLRRPHGALAFVDPKTLAPRARVALPAAARHLAYAPAEAAVVVPAESADRVLEVTPAGIRSEAKVGTHPHAAAAIGHRVFVADEHSDQVSVLRRGRLEASWPAPHQPGGIAAFAHRYVGLVAVSERVLQVYDAASGKELGEVDAGVGPTHIAGSGYTGFVADTEGDAVRKFAVDAHPVQTEVVPAPGAPYGIAADFARGRLWVTLTARNQLVEYAVGEGPTRKLATYPTVRQPNSVAVDPRSGVVYVAGRRDGRLQRIDPREERP